MHYLQNWHLLSMKNFKHFLILIFTIKFVFDCKMVLIFGKSTREIKNIGITFISRCTLKAMLA